MKMSQPICNNIPSSLFWKCAEFAGLYSPMSQVKRCIMLELLTVFAEFCLLTRRVWKAVQCVHMVWMFDPSALCMCANKG